MKKAKMIFGTLLTVLLIGALGYFTGFLANLFKAFDNTPFHPPPTDCTLPNHHTTFIQGQPKMYKPLLPPVLQHVCRFFNQRLSET